MPIASLLDLGETLLDDGVALTTRTGLDAGLDAHYKLDETSGTDVIDSSGNDNDGTYQGTLPDRITGPEGQIPYGQNFNGSSDAITLGTQLATFAGECSLVTWFRSSTAGTYRLFCNRDGSANGIDWYVTSAGNLTHHNSTVTVGSANGAVPFDGQWHLLVTTISATGTRLYVDGVRVLHNVTANAITASAATLYFGRYSPSSASWLNGDAASPRIYNRELTHDDITDLMVLGPYTRLDVARLARWKMGEATSLVGRNEVRSSILSLEMDAAGTPDTYGDLPAGASRYSANLDTPASQYCELTPSGTYIIHAEATAANQRLGISFSGLVQSGKRYVNRVRWRRTATGQGSVLFGGASTYPHTHASNVNTFTLNEWQDSYVITDSAGGDVWLQLFANGVGNDAEVEIDFWRVTEENALSYQSNWPTRVAGPGGLVPYAQNGNGSSDYATGPAFAAITGPASIAVRVRLDTDGTYRLASNRDGSGNGMDLYTVAGGALAFVSGVVNAQSGAGIFPFDGRWHTILGTRSTSGTNIYLDGVLVYNSGTSHPVVSSAVAMHIGRYAPSAASFVLGDITDVQVWNRELTLADAVTYDREAREHGRRSIIRPIIRRPVRPILQ